MTTNMIQEGDKVILRKDKIIKAFAVHSKRPVWIEKTKFTLEGIIGQPYGSLFEVRNGALLKIERGDVVPEHEQTTTKDCTTGKDNRNLLDTDANQKLQTADIVKMRNEGLAGGEIISHIIENSATFKEKTEYSQAKYIKKKKKKKVLLGKGLSSHIAHLLHITILRPNTRLLAEMYFNKSPYKINFLRIDTLSQILTYGNVFAHSKVMVVDTVQGLVLGAVLERTGGFSQVVQIHHANFPEPSRAIVGMHSFPSKIMDSLLNFPLNQLNQLKLHSQSSTSTNNKNAEEKSDVISNDRTCEQCDIKSIKQESEQTVVSDVSCSDKTTSKNTSPSVPNDGISDEICKDNLLTVPKEEIKTEDDSNNESMEESDEKSSGNTSVKRKRTAEEREAIREERQQKINAARQLLLEKNMDSLIIACKYHPTPIVSMLLEYMAPCRPVVIYSQYKEPLMDTYIHLKEKGTALNFRLRETWLREYQILPSRTHPEMQMSGGSGYILTFLTCATD